MDSMKPTKVFNTKEYIKYADDSVVSKTLVKNKNGSTTLFAFDKGQGLSEHNAPFDAMVSIVEGKCRVTIGGDVFELEEGQMILLSATIPHALEAVEAFKMLLVMIRDAEN